MEASAHELSALEELQKVDLEILHLNQRLANLPQRDIIMVARQKKEALEEKRESIAALKRETNKKLTRINDEDASLVKKEQGVQAAIAATRGNYRHIEARTKELEGIGKRRATLSGDRDKISADLQRINGLEVQVVQAIAAISTKEQEAVATFQEEGGALKEEIAALESQRETLIPQISESIMKSYDRIAARTGGVAVAHLEGDRCGACRHTIEGGHLIDLRAQRPLGICPSCKRLLIIDGSNS